MVYCRMFIAAHKILKKNGFDNANQSTSGNFNATTLKLVEKFDIPFSSLFIMTLLATPKKCNNY